MQPSCRSPDISAVNPQTTLDPLLVGFLMQRCSSASQPGSASSAAQPVSDHMRDSPARPASGSDNGKEQDGHGKDNGKGKRQKHWNRKDGKAKANASSTTIDLGGVATPGSTTLRAKRQCLK